MLFNLGLTADAAAAHESDLVGPQSPPNPPTRASSPLTALSSLPTLGTIYNKYKGMEPQATQGAALRDMTRSPVESVLSSDGEHSVIDTGFRASRVGRSHSVKKSLRPKTSYQLAHPASHAHHRCFKIRPKLLLQLQQVSHTPRPLPIFDVLPSTVFLPRLARKFPTIFRGKNGLGPNDLIIVTSDLYDADPRDRTSQGDDSDDEEQQEVIATICQLLNEEDLSKGKAEICFNRGPAWEATPLPNGAYEFVARTAQGVQTLRWVPRGSKSRRVSAPPGSPVQPESKRFTFSVINPNTRRHPVLASMTRNNLEVFDQYSMPTAAPSSLPTSAMSMISDGSDDTPLDRNVIAVDDDLRILIIVTSIWVAFREGWSHNFSYNDSALVLNSKMSSPVASRHASPTTIKHAPDYFSVDKENQTTENPPRKHRVSMSNVPLSSERLKSLASTRLARRSNSTGAAFIERSNRRSSGSKRPQRHSFLPPNDLSRDGVAGLEAIPSESLTNGNGQAQNGNSHSESTVKFANPEPTSEKPRRKTSQRVPQPEPTTSRGLDGQNSESGPPATKSKRRHRISGLFDCIFRRHH